MAAAASSATRMTARSALDEGLPGSCEALMRRWRLKTRSDLLRRLPVLGADGWGPVGFISVDLLLGVR